MRFGRQEIPRHRVREIHSNGAPERIANAEGDLIVSLARALFGDLAIEYDCLLAQGQIGVREDRRDEECARDRNDETQSGHRHRGDRQNEPGQCPAEQIAIRRKRQAGPSSDPFNVAP